VTRNINIGPDRYNVWNEYNLKTLTRNNWRASLVKFLARCRRERDEHDNGRGEANSSSSSFGWVFSFPLGRKPEMSTGCTLVNCRELLDGATGCPSRLFQGQSAAKPFHPPPKIGSSSRGARPGGGKGRFRDYNRVGESLRNSPSPPVMVLPCY